MQEPGQSSARPAPKPIARAILLRILAFLLAAFCGWSLLMLGKPYGLASLRELTGGVGPLDTVVNYSPQQAYLVLEQMGEMGREAYRRFMLLDLIYIPIYAAFLAVGANFFMRELGLTNSSLYNWRMLPIYAGIADFGEQMSLLAVLGNYPDRLEGVVEFMNLFTMAKLALFSLSALMFLVLFARWLKETRPNKVRD